MSGEADELRLIADYCTGEVPEWGPTGKGTPCATCKQAEGQLHNCRLCGCAFCSLCTVKLNVPDKFKKKGKKGPVRVCFPCRWAALLAKAQGRVGDAMRLDPRMPPTFERTGDGTIAIHVPEWVSDSHWCAVCGEKRSKKARHNCRACGFIACSSCSCKLSVELPAEFRKKGKEGAARICVHCRHVLIGGGAVFDATPQKAMLLSEEDAAKEEDAAAKEERKAPSRRLFDLDFSQDDWNRVRTTERRITETQPPPVPIAAAEEKKDSDTLQIRWEGLAVAMTTVPRVLLTGGTDQPTLVDLHRKLCGTAHLAQKLSRAAYLCRGEPVASAHRDVFCLSEKLFPGGIIYVRNLDAQQAAKPAAAAGAAAAAAGGEADGAAGDKAAAAEPEPVVAASIVQAKKPSSAAVSGPPTGAPSVLGSTLLGKEMLVALYKYTGASQDHVSFEKDDKLILLAKRDKWWYVQRVSTGEKGWAPAAYTKPAPKPAASAGAAFKPAAFRAPAFSSSAAGGKASGGSEMDDIFRARAKLFKKIDEDDE